MKNKIMRVVGAVLALCCIVALLPASGVTAFATSGTDARPTITKQPTDANIVCGQNAVMTVEAAGEDLTYQWYLDTGAEPYALSDGYEFKGTTTNTLTIVSTSEYYTIFPDTFNGSWSDTYFSGDRYYCVVSNGAGTVKTDIAAFIATHNSDGEKSADLNDHWQSCTCSLSESVTPSRHEHTYSHGVCAECGISEAAPRLAGGNRCDTAALISSSVYESAKNVVVASGNDYADALAGVALAKALDAPILLIRGSAGDSATYEEIERLGAENIYILGGKVAISEKCENEFKKNGYNVERICGDTRFGTCLEIAERLNKLSGKPDEIFLAYSHNYPDALAISSVSAIKGSPILYVAASGELTEDIAAFIKSSGVKKVTVLGGELAIGAAVIKNVENCGVETVQRLYGTSRYDTNIRINDVYADILTGDAICVATGKDFPDALAGGVLAADLQAPILLVGDSVSEVQIDYIKTRKLSMTVVLGGVAAVSESVIAQITA